MQGIETLFEIYKRAVSEKDISAFTSIFDENVCVFDMWHWLYSGIVSWRQMALEWFTSVGSDKILVAFDNIQIYYDNNIAGASAFVKFSALTETGQELRSLQNRLTWIIQKKNNNWKIIHEHTSSPIDGKTMQVMLQR